MDTFCGGKVNILFSGSVVRLQNQFPNEIVKRGAEVLETVSDNQPDLSGDGDFGFNDKSRLILAATCIGHEIALIRVKIPLDLGFNEVQIGFCMPDFLPDTIE
jgi:hypothetical protein